MKTVNYQLEMGEVTFPKGFFELIKDLPIDEQSKYFRTTTRSSYVKTSWSERTLDHTKPLDDDTDVKGLIIKDGCIVGVMMEEWFSKEAKPVMLDKCVCTYYACDNDGAGYDERTDYTFFVCVPKAKQ